MRRGGSTASTDDISTGIDEFFNASGVVRGNLIADNYYTACPIPLANSTGSCTDWVSTGILLYSVVPSAVKVSENFFRGDQRNQYLIPA